MNEKDINRCDPLTWALDNVSQCWHCKNCVGSKITDFYTAFMVKHPAHFSPSAIEEWSKMDVKLPECKKMGVYMTYVNHSECEKFERRD